MRCTRLPYPGTTLVLIANARAVHVASRCVHPLEYHGWSERLTTDPHPLVKHLEGPLILEGRIQVQRRKHQAVLWHQRHRIASTEVPKRVLNPGSAFALGAGMTVVDLPTALPYFAVIAAIVRSPHTMLLGKVILLAIFNVCYVLPLIGIAVLATFAGERAPHILERLRVGTARWAPVVLSGITLVAGLWLTVSGLRHLM